MSQQQPNGNTLLMGGKATSPEFFPLSQADLERGLTPEQHQTLSVLLNLNPLLIVLFGMNASLKEIEYDETHLHGDLALQATR